MEYKELEILLDKYFEGNTTLEEEQKIREFFLKNSDLPAKLVKTKAMFEFFQKETEKRIELPLIQIVNRQSEKNTNRRKIYFLISGIAASILILISVFNFSDNSEEQKVYAYINGKPIINEQVAKMEAKRALLLVSSNFNHGAKNLNHLTSFSKAEELIGK
ncbi:MAG: hypothetical protein DRI95_09930 [Bacteroidetes bacterium]|nr:MAG: hypothetical protein DRI95_09930 [Bacteroidota bacterium]